MSSKLVPSIGSEGPNSNYVLCWFCQNHHYLLFSFLLFGGMLINVNHIILLSFWVRCIYVVCSHGFCWQSTNHSVLLQVQQMGKLYKIVFRTGCFCNIGACQKYLNISTQQLRDNHKVSVLISTTPTINIMRNKPGSMGY